MMSERPGRPPVMILLWSRNALKPHAIIKIPMVKRAILVAGCIQGRGLTDGGAMIV